ncbi:hypothetical protein BKA59DRAFT_451242 [Fusarium tricinctum]|uniref:Uncharacterized protein n=1 Tax=Fusarium tricinctum TaxID=61284 RepID=A0A8K0S1H9_9HYPO|nr:hypothetical protein BKA59DRAFT_451242 [Fusarium tricinctum]
MCSCRLESSIPMEVALEWKLLPFEESWALPPAYLKSSAIRPNMLSHTPWYRHPLVPGAVFMTCSSLLLWLRIFPQAPGIVYRWVTSHTPRQLMGRGILILEGMRKSIEPVKELINILLPDIRIDFDGFRVTAYQSYAINRPQIIVRSPSDIQSCLGHLMEGALNPPAVLAAVFYADQNSAARHPDRY